MPPTPEDTIQRTVFSIQVDSLIAKDLSENMSRLSTQEDEILLFSYLSHNSIITQHHLSEVITFTKEQNKYNFNISFDKLEEADHISFFLIELDEEQVSPHLNEQCARTVQATGFPKRFDHQRLDSLLGDDDLLGMQSMSLSDCYGPVELTFRGRQLFDPYQYQLYLECK